MDFYSKENTKRNSKTLKRVIGYGPSKKTITSEFINISNNDKVLTQFIDNFLPQHNEIKNWEQHVDYSLKKSGRWKLLENVHSAWIKKAEELAEIEENINVTSFDPCYDDCYNVFNYPNIRGDVLRTYRNHGKLVEKCRLTKGKRRKSKLEKWMEGDPKKPEICDSIPNRENPENEDVSLNIQVFSNGSKSRIPPSRLPLKKQDKYARRSKPEIRGRFNHKNVPMGRIPAGRNSFCEDKPDIEMIMGEDNSVLDELETNVDVNPSEISRHFPLENFLIEKRKKLKATKSKMNKSLSYNKERKIIYLPYNDFPAFESRRFNNEEEYEEAHPASYVKNQVFNTTFNCLKIPKGWNVSYSKTVPVICEVWNSQASLLLIKSADDESFHLQSSDNLSSLKDDGSLMKCLSEIPRPKLKDLSQDSQVAVFHNKIAHRYLSNDFEFEEEIDTSKFTQANIKTTCDICMRECVPIVPQCGHTYCNFCWKRWLALPGGGGGKCPYPSCPIVLDDVALHWLAGPALYQDLQERMVNNSVKSDPFLHQCKFCKRVAKRESASTTTIKCICGHSYCCKCNQQHHDPATCEEMASYLRYSHVMGSYKKMETEVKVRKCPKCDIAWEKMYGCNHMTCGNCFTSFCWGCGGDQSVHFTNNGYWCGHLKVPLDVMPITPIPTEVAVMKKIEMFALYEQLGSSIAVKKIKYLRRTTKPLDTKEPDLNESLIQEFLDSFHILRCALLRDKTMKSKKKRTFIKAGVSSMENLGQLLFKRNQDFYCKSSIKLHLSNLRIAVKHAKNL